MLLYPEDLEVSKVCSILSDELNFKIDDLYSLKEIQKLVNSKENLVELLNQIQNEGIIKLSEQEGHIILNDNLILYNFINVPNKMTKEKLSELLEIKEKDIKRLYKQSLYWILVSENDEFNSGFEKNLKTIKFDEASLKYDITSGKTIRKQILKKIQHFNYIRETDDLKALSPSNPRKESSNRGDKISTNYHSNSNSEAFSWRKKSDVSHNSQDEHSLGNNKNGKTVSCFNPNANINKFARRERFNSDPHKYPSTPQNDSTSNQEIIIDSNQVKYPLTVNYKYSIKELYDFYEKNKERYITSSHSFKSFIEEVCNEKCKELSSISPSASAIRKNSYEMSTNQLKSNYEVKSFVVGSEKNEKIFIPKNNPLQEINLNFK